MRRLGNSFVAAVVLTLAATVASASDLETAQDVIQSIQKLKKSGQIEDFTIKVKVDGGRLWLRGNLASQEHKTTVLETVRRRPGVKQVVDGLTVAAGQPKPAASQPPVNIPLPQAQNASAPLPRVSGVSTPKKLIARPAVAPKSYVMRNAPAAPSERPSSLDKLVKKPSPRQVPATAAKTGGRAGGQQVVMVPVPYYMPQQGMPQQGMPQQGMPQAHPAAYPAYRGAALPSASGPGGQQLQPPSYLPTQRQVHPVRYENPSLPGYAWPSYAAYPNYAALQYPKQYSATAWPYIGPFYPYPQVPLGWRKVTLMWKDGWWQLDFKARH